VIKKAKGKRQESTREGPIPDSQLMPILYFLFPDAEEEPVNISTAIAYSSIAYSKQRPEDG
jgi:hypothetical protein